MKYDDRPWLKCYDEGVDPDFVAPDKTYPELIGEIFSDFASRPAIYYMGSEISFGELEEYSAKFAAFLAGSGCGPGDVVGINMPNIPQYLVCHVGTLRAGCVATGLSPLLSPREMAYQLGDCGAKALVTLDSIFEEKTVKFLNKVPGLSHIVVTNIDEFSSDHKAARAPDAPPGKTVISLSDLLDKYPAQASKAERSPDDTCMIQYTGGTTGMPKGAVLTHRNIVSNLMQSAQWMSTERGGEVYLSAYPLFHLAGLALGMSAMSMGNPQTLIPDPRNTDYICSQFEKYRPTYVANVPTLYGMLLGNPKFRTLDFSRLKTCRSGAAPFAVESLRALEEVVGRGKVVEVYGMSETSPILTMNPNLGVKKIGSVGVPIQSTFARIVDLETGKKEAPFGEEGELIVRGPQVTKGYYNKPEETAHALRQLDGLTWLYTGDVVRMDEDGFVTVVDRTKDMLNVGGYKVFSREVEETLYEHPAVEMCAIVGVPNEERPGSEIVKVVIQLKAGYRQKPAGEVENDIREFCRENLAPYKVPKIIGFMEQLPLTPVGKLDKKALR